jgi:CRP-like cAMP-binding protein
VSKPKSTLKSKLISDLDVFRSCTTRQLREIAGLCDCLEVPAGTVLCREGSRARQCMVIAIGSASAAIGAETIGTVVLGSIFGHRTIIYGESAAATITTLSAARLLAFSTRDFLTLAIGNPKLAPGIQKHIHAPDPLLHPRPVGTVVAIGS